MKCDYEGCSKEAVKWVYGFKKVVGFCDEHHKEVRGEEAS